MFPKPPRTIPMTIPTQKLHLIKCSKPSDFWCVFWWICFCHQVMKIHQKDNIVYEVGVKSLLFSRHDIHGCNVPSKSNRKFCRVL